MKIGEWNRGCESGHCVEVMKTVSGVRVRSSIDQDGPWLSFSNEEWGKFIEAAKRGVFDA